MSNVKQKLDKFSSTVLVENPLSYKLFSAQARKIKKKRLAAHPVRSQIT